MPPPALGMQLDRDRLEDLGPGGLDIWEYERDCCLGVESGKLSS